MMSLMEIEVIEPLILGRYLIGAVIMMITIVYLISVEHMVSRYQKTCVEAEERTTQEGASQDMGINNMCTRFRTCNELLQSVRRVDEEG